jgi:hypothetical protein
VKKALIGDPSSVGEEENDNDLWPGFYTVNNTFMRMEMKSVFLEQLV